MASGTHEPAPSSRGRAARVEKPRRSLRSSGERAFCAPTRGAAPRAPRVAPCGSGDRGSRSSPLERSPARATFEPQITRGTTGRPAVVRPLVGNAAGRVLRSPNRMGAAFFREQSTPKSTTDRTGWRLLSSLSGPCPDRRPPTLKISPGADSSKWFARSAGNGVDAAVCLVGGAHGAVRLGAGMASGFWRGPTRAPDAIHWLVRSNRLSFDARVRILRE